MTKELIAATRLTALGFGLFALVKGPATLLTIGLAGFGICALAGGAILGFLVIVEWIDGE